MSKKIATLDSAIRTMRRIWVFISLATFGMGFFTGLTVAGWILIGE